FGDVRYIVQGVNGVGLVGVDNNLGAGYTPGVPIGAPTPPTPPNTPPPVPTSIELGPTPVGGATGTTLPVSATLTGAPAGSSVTFSLGSVSSTTTTDGTGHASATLPLQDAVGGYTLTASYPGDATHRSSSATRPFAITKVSTTLSVTPGVSETISATLTRTVSATPLPQQTVIFTIISGLVTEQVAATTDPQGRATIPVGTLSNGAYTVSAQYLGTSTYAPALSGSALVTLAAAGPAVTLLKVTPSSIVVGGTTTLTALVADPSGVSRVEYFVGTDPGVGLATPLTPTLTGTVSAIFGANLPAGTYTVGVRALDRLGIWSAASTTTLTVSQIGVSVSTNANRTGAINLAGATVSGNVAVFATPPAGSSRVAVVGFYIDDPNRNSLPYWIQILSPYDLNGTLKNGTAKLFDTRLLLNGAHTLTVELLRLNGTHERRTVSFTVNNPAPAVAQKLQVSTSATRSNPADLNGRALAGSVAVFVTPTPSVKSVAFWLDKTNLTVLPRSIDSSAQFDFNGTGSNGQAVLFNVGSLAPGSHRIAARVTYTNGTTAVLSSTFTR
ncbi:MAG: Ig-like domain-containing protein, partial [Ilumatobacteraceae bacterium]